MRRLSSNLGIIGALLVGIAVIGEFADGFFCTRFPWFVIGPIDVLYLFANPVLLLGTLSALILCAIALKRREPMPSFWWRSQLLAWTILALMYFGGFSPRLSGLCVRANVQEKALIDLCRKYRDGGVPAVVGHNVAKWSLGFSAHFRSTRDYVEVSWGATLPRTWGFRIDDQERPVPQFVSPGDAEAAAATNRVTVFIGIW